MNAAAYRLLRGTIVSRGRLLFSGAIGALVALGGFGIGVADAPSRAAPDFLQGPGLGFLVPVVALIFAVASLGDLAEDRTLVFLWLRPVERWRLTGAAVAATLTPVLPLTVVPMVAATVLAGRADLAFGAGLSAAFAAVAYSALFTGLGLRTRRSLVWGLVYVLLWEGVVSNVSRDLSALSVRRYAASLLDAFGDGVNVQFPVGTSSAFLGLAAATAAGVAVCTLLLQRQDVD